MRAFVDRRRRLVTLHRPAWRSALALLLAAALAGCQSMPDIGAWNQATKDVTGAVTTGFHTAAEVNGDLATRLAVDFPEIAKRYQGAADTIGQRAVDYEKLFGAIADYAGSLAAIARASDKSADAVNAVAGSLNQLVSAVGGTALAGAGFELGKLLASEAIKVKAAGDFAAAVQQADPVIAQVADLLVKDLADLQNTVGPTKIEAIKDAVRAPYKDRVKYRTALVRRQAELQASVARAVAPDKAAPGDASPPTVSLMKADDAPELARVEQYLRDADAWFRPMQEETDRALLVRARSERLIIDAGRAISAWKASHASVAVAVRERRLPETARLVSLAIQIRDLAAALKKEK